MWTVKAILIIGVCLLTAKTAPSQCPAKETLWQRLIFLRDSSTSQPAEQLKELLEYEDIINKCEYRFDSTHSLLEQRIGVMYYYQADFANAIKHIRNAIQIVTSNSAKPTVNIKHLIRFYFSLSLSYDSINRVREKMEAIDSCIAIAIRTKSVDEYSLYPLEQRVEYLLDIGDFKRARAYTSIGESIIRQYVHGRDSIEYILKYLTWEVTALISSKDFSIAESLLANKIEECKQSHADQYLGTIYGQLAIVFGEKKQYDEALQYFTYALQSHQKAKYALGCQQTLTNLAIYIYTRNVLDSRKALITYRKALHYIQKDLFQNKDYAVEALNIYANIANLFVQQGRFDSAFYYFQLAFDQVKPGAKEEDILNSKLNEFVRNKKIGILISLLIDKGNAYKQQYRLSGQMSLIREAVRIYKITDKVLTRMKAEHSELQSKLLWRKMTRQLYEQAIEASYKGGNLDDAFYFFEKSRAVLLNDQLGEQRLLKDVDLVKLAQLRKRILIADRMTAEHTSQRGPNTEADKERFSIQQEIDQIYNAIKAANPAYYQIYLDSTFLTIADVQKNILQDHLALIEIFTGDSAVYKLTITGQGSQIIKIDKSIFAKTVSQYISYISNPGLLNRDFESFVKVSGLLHELIFEGKPLPAGRVIVSLDRSYFPFESLVTKSAPLTYFLNEHAVSYTYSARYLMNLPNNASKNSSNEIMGVAPVEYPVAMNLPALKGSDQSLNRIATNFENARLYLATAASRNNFMQHYSEFKILQLFTHASDSSKFGEPVIFFADSALYLSDLIGDSRPLTDLVVLSACETGIGRFFEGEGIFSFSRGFAAMGIPSSITNLWEVENESTYRLTELFFKNLAASMPYDLALQKAKLEFIQSASKEKKLPSYWAATVLAGNSNEVQIKHHNPWKPVVLFLGLSGLLIIGGVLYYRRFKINKASGYATAVGKN